MSLFSYSGIKDFDHINAGWHLIFMPGRDFSGHRPELIMEVCFFFFGGEGGGEGVQKPVGSPQNPLQCTWPMHSNKCLEILTCIY